MIHSRNPRLISLYAKTNRNNSYTDIDYITISKSSELNQSLMYALITTDWLINNEDIENKSIEEIKQECIDLENNIAILKDTTKGRMINHNIIDRIKLLQYKLLCLNEYLSKKENEFIKPNAKIKRQRTNK